MADIQYLSYGNQQIEKQALLNSLADNVQQYVQRQPWSKKRKEKFMSAYSDIISKELLGASVGNNGIWGVDVNSEVNLENLSKKDREMYGEAAWFIRHQMESLNKSTIDKSNTEEEKEKENLVKFDNDFFLSGFRDYIRNNQFGGNKDFRISDWNEIDPRNEYGIRGRSKRAQLMADLLEQYADELGKKTNYDFEGTPFKDINDFKSKIKKATDALRSENIDDDKDALWQLGIRESDWFNNGSGDPSGYTINGTPVTYGDYYNQVLAQEEATKNAAIKAARNVKRAMRRFQHDSQSQDKPDQANQTFFQEALSNFNNLVQNPRQDNESSQQYGNQVSLYADLASMIGDLISLRGGNANIAGSTMSLVSDLVSDVAKGENIKDIITHAGTNVGLAIAGNIPAFKVQRFVRKASKIYSIAYPIIIADDPSVQQTWSKLLSGQSINNKDIENLKWTLHAISGGINSGRDTIARRKFNKAVGIENTRLQDNRPKRSVKVETTDANNNKIITTKNLSESQVSRINRAGMRGGNRGAVKEFEKITGGKPVSGQFNFGENGRPWYHISRYAPSVKTGEAQLLRGEPVIDSRAAYKLYRGAMSRLNSGWHPFGENAGFDVLGKHRIFDNLGFRVNKNYSDLSGRKTLSYLNEIGYVPSSTHGIKYTPGQLRRPHIGDEQWKNSGQIEKQYNDFVNNRRFTSKEPTLNQDYVLGDTKYTIEQEVDPTKGYKLIIQNVDGTGEKTVLSKQSINDIKNKFADAIKAYRNVNANNFWKWAKEIQRIGELGYLKRGGKIDKQKIQKYKEYIQK